MHGDTLEAVTGAQALGGVRARCHRCDRTWKYHRWGEACDQVATHRAFQPARDESGEQPAALVCRAHARQLIEWGWSVRTDPGAPEASAVADADLAAACRRAARRRSVITAANVLLTGLGYSVRESSETPDDEHGRISLTATGSTAALVWFALDPAADVYVWETGSVPSADGGLTVMRSWPALVEALAVAAGAELPPVVLAARMADGGVEALAEDLAADLRPLIEYGYVTSLAGDPDTEVTVMLAGYGRRYGALFRAVDGPMIVFAGGWAELGEPHLSAGGRWVVDGLDDDGPVTWSAWPAFLTTLRDRAEAEGFGA